MSEQPRFNFGDWKTLPKRPLVILHWNPATERVESEWPEFGLHSSFASWAVALDVVLHPVNDHVRLKVRV